MSTGAQSTAQGGPAVEIATAAALPGVHVALATPVDADGNLDADGFDRLVAHVIDGGVNGICPTGSTGEGPRLTKDQRLTVLRTVRACGGPDRMIIPATCALPPADVINEIDVMRGAGASAVLVAPPFYYPMTPADQVAWFDTIAGSTSLPLVLYNIPAMTGVSLAPSTVTRLAALPRVIGIKDSSRDMEYLQRVALSTADADFAVLTGTDTLLSAALHTGAVGAIAASMNLVPQLARRVYDATRADDLDEARAAQGRLADIVEACRVGTPPSGWKAALAWAGICSARPVPPYAQLAPDVTEQLAAQLDRLVKS